MFEGAQIEVVLAKPADKAGPRYTRARNADTQTKTVVSLVTIHVVLTSSQAAWAHIYM